MTKRSKKHTRRLRNLVMLCTICAVVLTVSTYAWFIGMKTVNVSTFDIDIATTEGLFLSMDGNHWSYRLDPKNTAAYEGNTNTWANDGLIPMSSIGDMDTNASRMMLYEKASLTTTPGGYRLLASRVGNYATQADGVSYEQGEGYIAFDLFIKNLSGEEYYYDDEKLNEEAIYLTTNSEVKVADGGVKNTGIENSVRVAFAQIGRVKADTKNVKNITGISCANVAKGDDQVQVTGICRDVQIWEPNDVDHVQNAINWYEKSCLARLSGDLEKTDYDLEKTTTCGTVAQGTSYPTYAVARELVVGDNVDIYDGTEYNTFDGHTKTHAQYKAAEDKSTFKLVSFPYFTDTMKDKTGTERQEFMSLAPNSITKVRVYVYIEGQDIDNYDFASLGAKISVNFGFTKERFTENDINYVPGSPSTDITPSPGDEIVHTQEDLATPNA